MTTGNKKKLGSHGEATNHWLGVAYKLTLAFGIGLTMVYLEDLHFFPKGMGASDALFFIFIVVSFGFVYSILLFYGAFCATWLIGGVHWALNHGEGECKFVLPEPLRGVSSSITSFATFVFVGALTYLIGTTEMAIAFLTVWVTACILLFSFSERAVPTESESAPVKFEKLTPRTRYQAQALAAALALLTLVTGSAKPVVDVPFGNLGVRAMDTRIELSSENVQRIEAASRELGVPVFSCEILPNGKRVAMGVDVLWHNLGQKALIEFRRSPAAEEPNSTKSFARVELDDAGLNVVQLKGVSHACFAIPLVDVFANGKDQLLPAGEAMLDELANRGMRLGNHTSVEVVIHRAKSCGSQSSDSGSIDRSQIDAVRAYFSGRTHKEASKQVDADPKRNTPSVSSVPLTDNDQGCEPFNETLNITLAAQR